VAYRTPPPEVAELFVKPGAEWTEEERRAFVAWLSVEQQERLDRRTVRVRLGRSVPGRWTEQHVDEVIEDFYGMQLARVIAAYHPARGPFWGLYYTALDLRARMQARRLRGGPIFVPFGLDPPSGGRSPEEIEIIAEKLRRLEECLTTALSPEERRLVRARLDDEPYETLAARLGVDANTLRQRYRRAIGKLRACLIRKLAPPRQPPSKVATRPADIDVDVLIIGGGAMGLFVANDLARRGYSVLVLEIDRLGGGQTCHSHLYIHGGHVYREAALVNGLKVAFGLFQTWLAAHPEVERAWMPSIIAYRNRRLAQQRVDFWHSVGLHSSPVSTLPSVITGGDIQVAYETPEIAIRGQSLICALSTPIGDAIGRATTTGFSVDSASGRIERVTAVAPKGDEIVFHPRAVIFAAGDGNQALLDAVAAAGGGRAAGTSTAQQIRLSHMLAVKGPRDILPPLTGVFHVSHALFIVTRLVGSEVVWLVSDERGPRVPSLSAVPDSAAQWLPGIDQALRELAPTVFTRADVRRRLSWLCYQAPKAEARTSDGRIPQGPRIEQFGFSNLWVAWPTKLTLAPAASRELVQQVGGFVGVGSRWSAPPAGWLAKRCPAPVARERWEEAPADQWNQPFQSGTGVRE
jgi:RNA polymerase sigma factor (sigma-70 family)